MKKMIFVLFLGLTMISASSAWANHPGGKSSVCALSGKAGSSQCPVTEKLMTKAHFLLQNKEALGLSEDQIATIKGIKLATKKSVVRQTADFQILMLDVKSKLYDETIDVEGISAMVDQGFGAMASGVKRSVASYAKLKAAITPDQMTKAKELWKSQGR